MLHPLNLIIVEIITRLGQVLQLSIIIVVLLNILFGPTRIGNVLRQLHLKLLNRFFLSTHHGVRKQLTCDYDEIMSESFCY